MKWSEVKVVVKGVHDCEVDAEVIFEALLLSRSAEDFTRLLRGALGVTDAVHEFTYRDSGENS